MKLSFSPKEINPKCGENRSIRNRNTIFLFLFLYSSTDSVTQLLKLSFPLSKFAPFFSHFLFNFVSCSPPPPFRAVPNEGISAPASEPVILFSATELPPNSCTSYVMQTCANGGCYIYVCTAFTSSHNVIHGRWYFYYKQVEKEKVWKSAEKLSGEKIFYKKSIYKMLRSKVRSVT